MPTYLHSLLRRATTRALIPILYFSYHITTHLHPRLAFLKAAEGGLLLVLASLAVTTTRGFATVACLLARPVKGLGVIVRDWIIHTKIHLSHQF